MMQMYAGNYFWHTMQTAVNLVMGWGVCVVKYLCIYLFFRLFVWLRVGWWLAFGKGGWAAKRPSQIRPGVQAQESHRVISFHPLTHSKEH